MQVQCVLTGLQTLSPGKMGGGRHLKKAPALCATADVLLSRSRPYVSGLAPADGLCPITYRSATAENDERYR
jgi:hypothetical protein